MKIISALILLTIVTNVKCECGSLTECMTALLNTLIPNIGQVQTIDPVSISANNSNKSDINISVFKTLIGVTDNDTLEQDLIIKTVAYNVNPENSVKNTSDVNQTENAGLESLLSNLVNSLSFNDLFQTNSNKNSQIELLEDKTADNASDYPFIDYIELYNDLNVSGLFDFEYVDVKDIINKLGKTYEVSFIEKLFNKTGKVYSNLTFTFKGGEAMCIKMNVSFTSYVNINQTNMNSVATKLNDTSILVKVMNASQPVVLTIRGKEGLDFPRLQSFQIDDKAACDVETTKPVLALPIDDAISSNNDASAESLKPETSNPDFTTTNSTKTDNNSTIDYKIDLNTEGDNTTEVDFTTDSTILTGINATEVNSDLKSSNNTTDLNVSVDNSTVKAIYNATPATTVILESTT